MSARSSGNAPAGAARPGEPGFPPLDEELGRLPGALTPPLPQGLVRLGASVPVAQAATVLASFTHVTVSDATARRLTEQAGAADVAVPTAEAARRARAAPAPPPGPGPAVRQLSADGALVPLLTGEWGEVTPLVIGAVEPDPAAPDAVRTTEVTAFARRAEAADFIRPALVETHRRGVETAGLVEVLVDGSRWCPGVAEVPRPDAGRGLDHGHGVGDLATAAPATVGPGPATTSAWWGKEAHRLQHDDPAAVRTARRALPVAAATDPAAASAARDTTLGDLAPRWEQLHSATFRARG